MSYPTALSARPRRLSRSVRSLIVGVVTVSLALTAAVVSGASVPAAGAAPAVTLTTLQVEKKTEPVGIDVDRPRFSWVIETAERAVVQESYRLRIATSAGALAGGDLTWDSGVVSSDASSSVEYTGPALASATQFFWSVDVVTSVGSARAASSFHTGLYSEADWQGSSWIGNDRPQESGPIEMTLTGASWIHPQYAGGNTPSGYFRKTFTVDPAKTIAGAQLVMTGDRGYSVLLNEVQVASGRSVDDAWKTASRVAVSPQAGENVLAVRLDNTAKAYGAFVGKLTVLYSDGTKQDIVTDDSWLATRTAPSGWHRNDFVADGWETAAARTLYGGSPWGPVTIPTTTTPDTRMTFDTASWILPAIGEPSPGNPIPDTLFRRTIEVPASKTVAWAQLAVTGDQIFTAYWNGEKVAFNTGADNEWQQARAVALTAAAGSNVLALALDTPGNAQYGGVIARVRIGYTDGTSTDVVSDGRTKALVSSENTAPSGWKTAEFDDSGWQAAREQALYRGWVYGGQVTIPELNLGTEKLTLSGSTWIWTPEAAAPVAPGEPRAFRRTLESPDGKTATRAEIVITADDSFRLSVNGALLGATEGASNEWQQSHRFFADLDARRNTIAVQTTNGAGSPAGLVAAIRVTYSDGSTEIVRTDTEWKASKTVDAGFEAPGFDDSGWGRAAAQAAFGSGPWGGGVREPAATPNPAPLLRKEFAVDSDVRAATLFVAAGGYANVSLNGKPISDDVLSPGFTDYDDTVQYVANDVTELVKSGSNAIGLELGRGFFGMTGGNVWNWQRPPWHDEPVARLLLRLELADGTVKTVVTDDSWTIHDGPTRFDDLYGGELFDASKVQTGFDTVGFDDSGWEPAFEAKGPKGVLVNQRQQPIRVTEELPAVEITEPVADTYVVKFPRVIAGWVQYTAQGPAGTTIRSQAGEKLLPSGLPNFSNNGGFASGFQTDRFVLAGTGAPETWEPQFSYKGFQYIQVTGWPGDQPPRLEDFTAKVVHTDAREWGSFESSEPIMNQVHRAVVDTLKNNIHGIPTDTPMFEKNGWTGDAAVGAEMFMTNLDTHELFAKWMRDVHETRGADGAPEVIAPSSNNWGDTGNWGINPPWHSAYVMIPWWLYQYGNDDRVLAEQYDGMKGYLDLEYGRSTNGLVANPRLGDWVSPEASPAGSNAPEDTRVSATAYLYAMLTSMQKSAALLGKTADAAMFAERAAVVKDTFNATFLDRDRGLYRGNGSDRGYRQTHNVLALAFGLAPDAAMEQRVAASIADDVAAKGALNTGVLGTKYLLPVLTKYGYEDVAFQLATSTSYPSWGFMVANGGTTMWEHWSLEARSLGHYFLGTVDDWFYKGVAGIAASESEGYRKIEIAPAVTAQMDWAKAETQTPFGPVSVDWKREGGALRLDTHVPVGSTATVRLPAPNAWAVSESGSSLDTAKGVLGVAIDGDDVVVTVASGDYSFTVDADAGAVGDILDRLAEFDAEVTARHSGGALDDAAKATLLAGSDRVRDEVKAALAVIGEPSRAAERLAGAILALDELDRAVAAVATDEATRAALATKADAVRTALGLTISGLLDIEAALTPPPGTKPGESAAVRVLVDNGGDRDISRVRAALTGLSAEWATAPEPTPVADEIKSGTDAAVDLAFTAPLGAPPGPVAVGGVIEYGFGGATVRLAADAQIVVDTPLQITSVTLDPATVRPGGVTTLVAQVANVGAQPTSGHLGVVVPAGWQTPLATGDVVIPAGQTVSLSVPVVAPLDAKAGSTIATLTAAFERDGVRFAARDASLTVQLAPIDAPAPGYDHIDLGDATSETAHGLTASPSSGTNTEAGLTRRYAGHLVDFSKFEFDMAVVPGEPFVIRSVETYDRAQTKKYKVYVDGVEVHTRQFAHTGGVGTETYEFVVPAERATDASVRVRFETQTDHSFYDPSIADVWTAPVPRDTVAPQIVSRTTPASPDPRTGWFTRAPVGVELKAQDDRPGTVRIDYRIDGGASAEYDAALTLDGEGEHTVVATATDRAGNHSQPLEVAVRIDTKAPTTAAEFSDDFDDDHVAKDRGVIELTPTDATSGVGATRYRVDGGAWTDGTTVELATRGVHTVEFFSLDVAGNAETVKSVTGEIVIPDRIPPTVTHTVSNPGTNGWYLGGAAVTVSATDSESGVASVEYRLAGGGWQLYGDPVVLPEGETLFEYRATDVAGNVSGILSERIKVDGTRPGVWAWLSSAGRVSAVGTDSASGMQRLEYSLDGSTWGDLSSVVTATPKPESLSVRAIDRAGNASTVQEVVRTARPPALSIEPGSSILVEGSGFTKGAKVRVELHSDPLLLATATANGVGVISALASVPADFPSGAHSLVLVEQGGAAVTLPTQIAATGFAAEIWVPLGAGALLILGAALLVLTRRRRVVQVKR